MVNTCEFPNCEFAKILMLNSSKQCPNYVESLWTKGPMQGEGNSRPQLVCDCSPRRTFLMIQELYNRLIGTQQAVENIRNEIVWTEVVANVVGKNLGLDLEKFVQERQRLVRVQKIKEVTGSSDQEDIKMIASDGELR